MFSTTDTIVAIATPPGRGGLGVVRLSGADAAPIAAGLVTRPGDFPPRRSVFARLADPVVAGGILDQVIVTLFPGPRSYTGEDVVEISAHGNPWLLAHIVETASRLGARVAEPGEFTFRAYVNGRMDLVRAEAVADLVEAVTPAQVRAASDQLNGTLTGAIAKVERTLFDLLARLEASLDFPDEGYHFVGGDEAAATLETVRESLAGLLASSRAGRVLREGRALALIGRTNVGKSSLFNALVGSDRAIVSAHAGTTRDVITERCVVHGIPLTLVDTAGWRATDNVVEAEGVRRAERAAQASDVVVVVVDGSTPLVATDRAIAGTRARSRVVAITKADLPPAWPDGALGDAASECVRVSAVTGMGIDVLRTRLVRALIGDEHALEDVRVTNVRHARLLERALAAVRNAWQQAAHHGAEELVVADVQEAMAALQEITGRRAPDAVLREIFSRFCIGK